MSYKHEWKIKPSGKGFFVSLGCFDLYYADTIEEGLKRIRGIKNIDVVKIEYNKNSEGVISHYLKYI